jgi:hypothetical protein
LLLKLTVSKSRFTLGRFTDFALSSRPHWWAIAVYDISLTPTLSFFVCGLRVRCFVSMVVLSYITFM